MKKITKDDLQELREELNAILEKEGCVSQEALAVSRKLDKLILEYYRNNMAAAS